MSLLNHKQRLTPSGRFEILGRDASMLVGEEYFNQRQHPGGSYWEADTSFGFGDGAAVDALDALAWTSVSDVPERASEEYQSRLFLESIANDSDPGQPWCPWRSRCTTWRSCGPCTSRRTRALR